MLHFIEHDAISTDGTVCDQSPERQGACCVVLLCSICRHLHMINSVIGHFCEVYSFWLKWQMCRADIPMIDSAFGYFCD